MTHQTYTVARPCSTSQHHHEPVHITLPASPGVTITTDRSETAPRSAPIRGEFDWRKDRTLRHAGRIGR